MDQVDTGESAPGRKKFTSYQVNTGEVDCSLRKTSRRPNAAAGCGSNVLNLKLDQEEEAGDGSCVHGCTSAIEWSTDKGF